MKKSIHTTTCSIFVQKLNETCSSLIIPYYSLIILTLGIFSKRACWDPFFSMTIFSKTAHFWSSHPEVFLGKGVLKICSKFTGNTHAEVWFVFFYDFIEITLWHGCSSVNLLHIFSTPSPKKTFGWVILSFLLIFRLFI